MKKLLFISLLFSVPAWGMEGESDVPQEELATELFYEVDPEKLKAFIELRKIRFSTEDLAYDIMHLAEQGEEELEKYRKELEDKKNKKKWFFRAKYLVTCSRNSTAIENVKKFTMRIEYEELRDYDYSKPLSFNQSHVKSCLQLLPYFKRIVIASELESMIKHQRQQNSAQLENKKNELLKILLEN